MNVVLAALLNTFGQQVVPSTSSGASATADAGAQFKAQFGQAVAALSGAANGAHAGGTAAGPTTGTASAAPTDSANGGPLDAAQSDLQQKIKDLLAQGISLDQIVQQLAAALANAFAARFGGDPSLIASQLQSAFATALAPPNSAGTGPPSAADLAAALAQRFRQIAELATRAANGETGQSNRLFAGSTSDAAPTAGANPAPTTNEPGPTADSTASAALASLAPPTAPSGDGPTVAVHGAPLLGSNGDTLLGRILARAAQSSAAKATTPSPSDVSTSAQTNASASADAFASTVASAAASLAPAPSALAALARVPLTSSTPSLTDLAASLIARTQAAQSSTPPIVSTAAASSGSAASTVLAPAVLAFVKTISDALATSTPVAAPKPNTDATDGNLLSSVTSSQAPTVGAFAPVQPSLAIDPNPVGSAPASPLPAQPPADPNAVVDQLVRGVFLPPPTGPQSEVRLKLVPETLGDLTVKLTVTDGTVNAQVIAQTAEARDALLAGQPQLVRALADAGLKLDSFNVELAGSFGSFGQQPQQQQSFERPRSFDRRMLLDGVDTVESDESTLSAIPSFGPPLAAPAGWASLNYLA